MVASSSRFLLRTLALISLLIYSSGASQPAWAEESSVPPPLPAYATAMAPRVQPLMEQMLIPGAVVAVRSPEFGDWTAAFGYRDLAHTQPITVEDHFRIGSNTKTMTGTVVLQLVDEGKVHLEDPISDYVDGVPNGEKITLDLLLRMRSGLTNYTQDRSLNEQLDTNRFRIWTPSELLALAFAGPEAVPNSEYEYCNTNTVLLGKVIEKVLQQPAEEAVTERIFQRLELAHTLLPLAGNNSIPNPHPRGYLPSCPPPPWKAKSAPTREALFGRSRRSRMLLEHAAASQPSGGRQHFGNSAQSVLRKFGFCQLGQRQRLTATNSDRGRSRNRRFRCGPDLDSIDSPTVAREDEADTTGLVSGVVDQLGADLASSFSLT